MEYMKTAEERAKEYADGMYPNTDNNDYSRTTAEEWDACYDGYVEGYNEAMRWRDPKDELPKNAGLYLCKCEKELGFYFDIVFFNKVWRSDNVIGWRPIE